MAFADHVVRDLGFAGGGRRSDDDVGKQGAINNVGLVLCGEFADYLGAARRIGAVILDDDFDRAAVDAPSLVDELDGGVGGFFVPAAIGGTDAGSVGLETDLDRGGTLCLRIADKARSRDEAGGRGQPLERRAAIKIFADQTGRPLDFAHAGPPPQFKPKSSLRRDNVS